MNAYSRPSPFVYGEERDTRTDHEKLKDAIERHMANARALKSVSEVAVINEAKFGRAQSAYDGSQSDLFILIEDITHIPAAKLREALSI